MAIELKSRRELEMMRRAGNLAYDILRRMREMARPGVATGDIDEMARVELEKAGAFSPSKNFPTYKPGEGFPGYTCISVNEEVIHGVPGRRTLAVGDIVKLDMALSLNGYCADTAVTVAVGQVSPRVQKLLEVTRETFDLALSNMKLEKKWSEIARLMQWNVEKHGFSVVREFVGHGVGRSMHEDPKVPNFANGEQLRGDFRLKPGITIAVEPMVAMGTREVKLLSDGWTAVTADGKHAAHHEHTVAMMESGPIILTDGSCPPFI